MPKFVLGKSQESTLNRIEVQKYGIISGELSILKSTVLPFFIKTLVLMARHRMADQTRSQVR
jgi:hypothetical protein